MKLWTILLVAAAVRAQEPPSAILFIHREQVQPGRMSALVHIEEDAARFCATAHCPNPYIAISSVTGPEEICWINGFDTVDTMEKVWHDYAANAEIAGHLAVVAQQKADLVLPSRSSMARFRDDLSFSTNITFAYTRFISISVVQVRPGLQASFEKIRGAIKNTLQRSGRPQWVYQVTSGAEDTTFLIFTPGRTMQEIHLFSPSDERIGTVAELMRDAVVSSETRLYAVSPSMSMPAPSWLEADPEFWKRP